MIQSFFWDLLLAMKEILFEMSPYLIIGLIAAGILNRYVPRERIQKFASPGFKGPLLSALFGIPLPLCSCSVLPFAVQMKKSGGSKGSILAFLTATPQTGIDSIMVAYSFFGLPFALFKAGAALITGTVGGWIGEFFFSQENTEENTEQIVIKEESDCDCGHCGIEKKSSFSRDILSIFNYGFGELMGDFSRSIFFGILIAGIIAAFIPESLFSQIPAEWMFYPAVLILSIPFYICATSSIPLAFAFVAKGMPIGAAIVFLIAGPATNAATIGVVYNVLGKKNTILYIVNIAVLSIVAGLLFDFFNFNLVPVNKTLRPFDFPAGIELISAILFIGVIIYHGAKRISLKIFSRE